MASRYISSRRYFDIARQETYLGPRTKLEYQDLDSNIYYEVHGGETLHSIAATVYATLARPPDFSAADLAYVIADYQPDYGFQIQDLYMVLPVGTRLTLPSVASVATQIKDL